MEGQEESPVEPKDGGESWGQGDRGQAGSGRPGGGHWMSE